MQENRHAREPNHEHGSIPEALCLDPTRKESSHRVDEDGHPCTLYGERQGTEDGRRKSLTKEFHRSRQFVRYTMRSVLLRQPTSLQHARDKKIASAISAIPWRLHHCEVPFRIMVIY